MKRYDLGITHHELSGSSGEPDLLESINGEWVAYKDYKKLENLVRDMKDYIDHRTIEDGPKSREAQWMWDGGGVYDQIEEALGEHA